jgi:hypothetical protein
MLSQNKVPSRTKTPPRSSARKRTFLGLEKRRSKKDAVFSKLTNIASIRRILSLYFEKRNSTIAFPKVLSMGREP